MDRFRKNCSVYFSITVIIAAFICLLMMKDTGTTAALRWLAVVFSVSFFMRPYLPVRNLKSCDNWFGVSFGLGLFLCFYVSWNVSALGLCEYSDPVCYLSFIALALAGAIIRCKVNGEKYLEADELLRSLRGFAVFAAIFVLFFWIIGFNPAVDNGTENYMDFGFMQTIYRQRAAIPIDPWFGGTKLNYYYLGQSASVYMCRLAHTTPEFGYNMMLATFIGMVFVMVFETGYATVCAILKDDPGKKACALSGGIIGAITAAFGANPHWLLYGVIFPAISRIKGEGYDPGKYWFPDGTVYIRSELGDPDNGKNEFPAYSVILGDLHAHVINLIFVLPLVAILFDHCFGERAERDEPKGSSFVSLILISMILGHCKGANYWDFAIYFVITGAVIVFTDLKRYGCKIKTFGYIGIKAALVTVVSVLSPILFTREFIRMESGVSFCENHTPIFKFCVLWLIQIVIKAGLILYIYSKRSSETIKRGPERKGLLAFVLCTIGLIILPEVIYIKDIYGSDNKRFNTMFKLTYEAYTLFAIIIGIAFGILVYTIVTGNRRRICAISAASLIAIGVAASAAYTPYAVRQWYGDVWDKTGRKGISSLEELKNDATYGFEMQAYDVLMQDDRRIVNIVETAGNSYTHESALSVYTGACTPVGWFVHEWMWHNDSEPVKDRADQVAFFYQSGNEEFCKKFLRDYDIDYIFVGPAEVCRYPVNRKGFSGLGDGCVSTLWQDCELSLIRVDRSKL